MSFYLESYYTGKKREEIEKQFRDIPNKMAFKIGEVAKILDLKPSILRFWETEFKELSPPKSRSKQRAYRHKDIKVALIIKKLLYEDRFSIEGAKSILKTVPLREESIKDSFKEKEEGLISFNERKDEEGKEKKIL